MKKFSWSRRRIKSTTLLELCWIDWCFKDHVPVKDLLPYLWRLAELANEMSNERDNQLWGKVQKQQGAMLDQYQMGQKLDRLMTVSANVKDELGNAMKIIKDSRNNF